MIRWLGSPGALSTFTAAVLPVLGGRSSARSQQPCPQVLNMPADIHGDAVSTGAQHAVATGAHHASRVHRWSTCQPCPQVLNMPADIYDDDVLAATNRCLLQDVVALEDEAKLKAVVTSGPNNHKLKHLPAAAGALLTCPLWPRVRACSCCGGAGRGDARGAGV